MEPSSDQVNKPINTAALIKWVGHIPPDVRTDMADIAPMLARLGYDPHAYPPNYGTADKMVQEQSAALALDEKANKMQPKQKS